jgi:hypothetical protein
MKAAERAGSLAACWADAMAGPWAVWKVAERAE